MEALREEIPSIIRNPIKFQRKWFAELFTSKDSIEDTNKRFHIWLEIIDGCGLLVSGLYYSWIYHHGVLQRLMWLLLVYDVSTTTVKAMESKESGYLRRWLRVPLSITWIGLYSNSTKVRKPVPSQGSKMPPGDDFLEHSR